MTLAKAVGAGASARKYDILTAMMAFALGEGKATQCLVLRAMSLITARYNWRRDELTVGQREIARMWSVDERTVKREMSKLRTMGWFVLRRPGARGRVSVYGLDHDRILYDTRPAWSKVGEDFVYRLTGLDATPTSNKVVPIRPAKVPVADGCIWNAVLGRLHTQDEILYANWFAQLSFDRIEEGTAHLLAANRFHARFVSNNYGGFLISAFRAEDPSLIAVKINATD